MSLSEFCLVNRGLAEELDQVGRNEDDGAVSVDLGIPPADARANPRLVVAHLGHEKVPDGVYAIRSGGDGENFVLP